MAGIDDFPRDQHGHLILPASVLERFWHYVDRRGPDACWEWQGRRGIENYGEFTLACKVVRAYRLSFEMHIGSVAPGFVVRHRCNYAPCVNPAHLVLGTRAQNSRDRVLAGRQGNKPLSHLRRPSGYRQRPPLPRPSAQERFWAKVRKSGGCWEWTASLSWQGYGNFAGGKSLCGSAKAHRFSWVIHFGAIPEGLRVLHTCDNRRCVRPDHLFLGTIADNNADMMVKGRHVAPSGDGSPRRLHPESYPRGDNHPMRKRARRIREGG